jgi:hypothetical protein
MSNPAAFQATYSDFRLVRSRKVVQLVFEVPLEASPGVLDVLGGMPNPAAEIWCAIARLRSEKEDRTQTDHAIPAQPAPNPTPARAPIKNYAQMAAIVGSKPAFWLFARERGANAVKDAASAADYIRSVCGVTSRSEIEHESKAGNRWLILHSAFLAWDDAVRVGAA